MTSEDEFRELQIQSMLDRGIDPSLVHYHPYGATTACGLSAMVFMGLTPTTSDVTCPACKQYISDYVY